MIRGIYISDGGDVQILGDVVNFSAIIKAMEIVLPQLKEQYRSALLADLSEEELMKALTQIKRNTEVA